MYLKKKEERGLRERKGVFNMSKYLPNIDPEQIVGCAAVALGVGTLFACGMMVYGEGKRAIEAIGQHMGTTLARTWDPIFTTLECHLEDGRQYGEGVLAVQGYQVIGERTLEDYDGRFYLRPEGAQNRLGERGEMLREGEDYIWENEVYTATVKIVSIDGGIMDIEWSGRCREYK